MTTKTVTTDTLDDAVEWDRPFTITAGAPNYPAPNYTDDHPGLFAPDVLHDPDGDVTVEGDGWEALTGHSGQDRYNGPIMHISETLSGGLADRIVREGGTYVITEVRDEDGTFPDGDPIGWAVLRYMGDSE